ncbi:hypothetical protein SAMN02799643_06441 [Methylobacterium sp. UNCCL125]|nr:hypothetical protein SAMN02799643_06441 [Methylobacterium sp. UNCCL125]
MYIADLDELARGTLPGSRRQSPEAINYGKQDVLEAAASQLFMTGSQKLAPLVLLQPETVGFLGAVDAHTDRDVNGFVLDKALVTYFDPHCTEQNDHIDRL